MRLLLVAALGLSACIDDPCRGFDGPTLRVAPPDGADGSPDLRTFDSIRAALEVAEPGTAVCVAPGIWREQVRVRTPDVHLLGAGPDLTILEPPASAEDPLEASGTVVALEADDAELRGFTVRGGVRGVWLSGGHDATLAELSITNNATGLLSLNPGALRLEDVELVHNVAIGGLITSLSGGPTLVIEGGAILGNGRAGRSEVGGLYSDRAVSATGLRLRDNAGVVAADLLTQGSLTLVDSRVDRPAGSGEAPRLYAGGGATVERVEGHTAGSPLLRVRCDADDTLMLENLALTDTGGSAPLIELEGCAGRLAHATLVDLSDANSRAPISLSGGGAVELVNSALLGFGPSAQVEDGGPGLTLTATWEGRIPDARLVRAYEIDPDLRPQSDSPLVDRGTELDVTVDLAGRSRPVGDAPDLGAFELY
ncbi:MAG: hypothetical protein H6739_02310 [Alphaproteobacteria bacterium]|nr:hypothetical protein [Alphaproteobacteria bacterium]